MSLILDALRKLERDRQAPDPNVVVVGPQAWPAPGAPSRWRWVALAGLLAAAITTTAAITWRLARPAPAARPEATARPQPAVATPPAGAPRLATPPPVRPMRLPGIGATDEITDPTLPAPVEEPAATPRAPQLMAISQREGRPIAVIDDRLMREGDSFDGLRVIRIGDAEVEVEWRGRRRLLRF